MDKTQMFQITHHIHMLIRTLPQGTTPQKLSVILKNRTGTILADLIVSGQVDETVAKTAGHYPAVVTVAEDAGQTFVRASYLLV